MPIGGRGRVGHHYGGGPRGHYGTVSRHGAYGRPYGGYGRQYARPYYNRPNYNYYGGAYPYAGVTPYAAPYVAQPVCYKNYNPYDPYDLYNDPYDSYSCTY